MELNCFHFLPDLNDSEYLDPYISLFSCLVNQAEMHVNASSEVITYFIQIAHVIVVVQLVALALMHYSSGMLTIMCHGCSL